MTLFNGQRLSNDVLKLDVEGLRRAFYTDRYFENVRLILQALQKRDYTYQDIALGELEVEAQWFTRRKPRALVAGVDVALEMLRHCTGYISDTGEFVNTFDHLEVEAVEDGVFTAYHGDPMWVQPVLKVRGIYQHFGVLETTTLGVLSRASRVATNTYELLQGAKGKEVLFFPARYDLYDTQATDGYAYYVGVERYNHDTHSEIRPLVSTDAQGAWWGGRGGGTVPHALLAVFQGDTAEAMLQFADILPVEVPRIALVDFHNDCTKTSAEVAEAMFRKHQSLLADGDNETATKYKLTGVRLDTGGHMRDESIVEAFGVPVLDMGVNARLVQNVRRTLDTCWQTWDIPDAWRQAAEDYCRAVKIIATGGFSKQKMAEFEEIGIPVDVYGIGSKFFLNDSETNTDFTMDVVRVKLNGEWIDMAKVGRQPCANPDLNPIS